MQLVQGNIFAHAVLLPLRGNQIDDIYAWYIFHCRECQQSKISANKTFSTWTFFWMFVSSWPNDLHKMRFLKVAQSIIVLYLFFFHLGILRLKMV